VTVLPWVDETGLPGRRGNFNGSEHVEFAGASEQLAVQGDGARVDGAQSRRAGGGHLAAGRADLRSPSARRGAVLDVGCGTGELTARLAAKFPARR